MRYRHRQGRLALERPAIGVGLSVSEAAFRLQIGCYSTFTTYVRVRLTAGLLAPFGIHELMELLTSYILTWNEAELHLVQHSNCSFVIMSQPTLVLAIGLTTPRSHPSRTIDVYTDLTDVYVGVPTRRREVWDTGPFVTSSDGKAHQSDSNMPFDLWGLSQTISRPYFVEQLPDLSTRSASCKSEYTASRRVLIT